MRVPSRVLLASLFSRKFAMADPAGPARCLRGADPSDGPLDCHGHGSKVTGRCHDECEARHLDDLERTRFEESYGFRYPGKPSVVITASRDMSSTASTWAFNAVRLLFRQAREACDSYWMRQLSREKLEKRLETGAHVLVKTHEWTGEITPAMFDQAAELFTHVVVSVREGFEKDPAWMKVATHVINFEELVSYDKQNPDDPSKIGALSVLRKLSDHLGLALTDQDLRVVDFELMTLPMPSSGCNQTTKHWPFHKRRGGRPVPRDPRLE
eukprot:CAMPEP_0181411144 /NCGR_PEP_ID=MMETSP1110-20121109/7716_1 /TAXON_ID=174948 /ORGANISM="Symbiodinium sp., Strain CCMP421" /LENGTH=268 /DNA_ID=CAMNT_0023533739 /DNA_START=12 /DNA_END=818 /DNA_ORIENTATION=-